MKVRLLELGYDNLNGFIGRIEFKAGVSVNDICQGDADKIASAMRAETVDGKTPIGAATIVEAKETSAVVIPPRVPADSVSVESNLESSGTVNREAQITVDTAPYTFESLGTIADTVGITGLREIAEPLGVKGRSVKELIDGIVKSGAVTRSAD